MPVPKRSTVTKSIAKKSTPKKSSTRKPAARKSTAKKSTAKKSTAKKPAPKKPAPKKSASKKPTSKRPVSKKPVPKKPVPKKPASKKPVPKKPARPIQEQPVTYTLSELAVRYGTASEAEIFSYVTRDRTELIADGADVATSRIETDCARLYGLAGDFYARADARQQRALRGFGEELLRIAIFAARHGQELAEARRRDKSSEAGRQAQRQDMAQTLRQSAVARRDQLTALLRLAAGGNAALEADIDRRIGRIASPELLSQALDALSELGRRFLKSGDAALKLRAGRAGLDAAYLDETGTLSRRIATELKSADAAREQTGVVQAEVDLWDGVNLFLIERIIELFEVAHAIEPTVPRLVPLSLRGWFGRSPKPKTPDAPPSLPASPTN